MSRRINQVENDDADCAEPVEMQAPQQGQSVRVSATGAAKLGKTAPAIATKGCLVVGGRGKQPFPETNREARRVAKPLPRWNCQNM